MNISDKGIHLIKKFEGCVLHAYDDSTGVWTIGYGHTYGVQKGQWITQSQAEKYLKNDLKIYETGVLKTGLKLNQNQFDALVSFTYNCGIGNLNTLIKNRNINQIGQCIVLYNKAGGRVLQGLINRRREEKALFFTKEVVKYRTLELTKPLMYGNDVKECQKRLIEKHFYPDNRLKNKGLDGIYGKDTKDALKRWQSVYTPNEIDGIYGKNSKRMLESQTR